MQTVVETGQHSLISFEGDLRVQVAGLFIGGRSEGVVARLFNGRR